MTVNTDRAIGPVRRDNGPLREARSTKAAGGYRWAVAHLATQQKPGAGVPAYLRWVNRGLGRRAAAAAFVLRLTPNLVTALSAILSLTALVLLATLPASPLSAATATALLLAGYALDSADGQLARLTGRGSIAGEWLDHVVDAARLPLFHLAVAVHLFRAGEEHWVVLAAIAFLILSSVWFFAQTLAEKLSPLAPVGSDAPAWVSFIKLPYDVGLLYATVALLSFRPAFVTAYLAVFVVTALVAMLSLARKYAFLQAAGMTTVSELNADELTIGGHDDDPGA
jgi:phosphatidylglycerophosphate synthase